MKNLVVLLLAICTLSSCSNLEEESLLPAKEKVEFTASATPSTPAQGAGSRAEIENVTTVVWSEGDAIATYVKSYASSGESAFVLELKSLSTNKKNATFGGTGAKPEDVDTYYAAYPQATKLSDGRADFTISSAQNGLPEPLMAALCKNTTKANIAFVFSPVNATLHITLDQPVDKVTFEACDGAAVAGTYTFTYANGATALSGTEKSIVVTPATRDLLVSVPAMTYAKGYKLTVEKGADRMIYSYGFAAGKTLEKGVTYPVTLQFKPIAVTMGTVESSCKDASGVGRAVNLIDGAQINGSTIIAKGASFDGISATLVSEVGYFCNNTKFPSASVAKSFNGQIELPQIALNWKNQEVKAYISVNGVDYFSASAASTTLSGIPYAIYANTKETASLSLFQQAGWSYNDKCIAYHYNIWPEAHYVYLEGTADNGTKGYMITPKFNIQGSVAVTTTLNAKYDIKGLYDPNQKGMYVGASDGVSCNTANKYTIDAKDYTNYDFSLSLTLATAHISYKTDALFKRTHLVDNWGYHYIHEIHVKYQ
ncbi:MAG: hypothetical protein RR182_08625 [Alistipes sp.]